MKKFYCPFSKTNYSLKNIDETIKDSSDFGFLFYNAPTEVHEYLLTKHSNNEITSEMLCNFFFNSQRNVEPRILNQLMHVLPSPYVSKLRKRFKIQSFSTQILNLINESGPIVQ